LHISKKGSKFTTQKSLKGATVGHADPGSTSGDLISGEQADEVLSILKEDATELMKIMKKCLMKDMTVQLLIKEKLV
jgi:hypothetical protein